MYATLRDLLSEDAPTRLSALLTVLHSDIEDPDRERINRRLRVLLAHEDTTTRLLALNALMLIGQAEDLVAVIRRFEDRNADVRLIAVRTAGIIAERLLLAGEDLPRRAIDPLVQGLIARAYDPDWLTRSAAVLTMAEVPHLRMQKVLAERSTDTNRTVRRLSADALAKVDGPAGVRALVGMLNDDDPHVVAASAQAIFRMAASA